MLPEKNKLRKTGIEIIGDVPWGTHFCQFYRTKEDLLDILVPYFKKGLLENEFCMWVTAEPLGVDDAHAAMTKSVPHFERYVEKGQIEILPYSDWYIKHGKFEEKRVLSGWVSKLNKALEHGYSGLRLTGNTFWIEKKDWKAFADYETTVNDVIGNYKMLAICTYSLDKCGANEILDIVNAHQFTIIKRGGAWRVIESSELKESRRALRAEIEERRRSERALRVSEQRYATTLSSIGDAVIATDVDGRITFMNDVAEKLTGWTLEKALHRPLPKVFRVINEYTRREIDNPVDIAIKKRGIVNLANNSVLIRKDKAEIPIEDSAAPIRDRDTTIYGVVLVFRDITARRKAEESIMHLASFPGLTPNPVVELTSNGEVIYSNPVADQLFSDLRKLNKKHPYIADWRFITSQLKKNPGKNLRREIGVGESTYMQTIQYVSSHNVFRIYGSDISIRKRMEEFLRKSEARFKALYDANIIGVVHGDLKNNIFDANDAFLNIVGYSREELISEKINCVKLTLDKYRKRDEEAFKELLARGVTTPWEKEYTKKDGSLVPVIIGKVLVNKDTGETIAFVLDITERKRLEQRKDEFIGTASHELKTPIAVIKAFTEIMLRRFEKSKDKQNEYLANKINSQADRLTSLVNDLLDISKIQAGRLKYNHRMIDLDELITKAVSDFQYLTKTHQIKKEGGSSRKLYGDEGRINQVMVNLLSNAVKYSPDADKVIVRIKENKENVLISVQDFGLGVPYQDREKIFERFYTDPEKKKREIPSVGLGLYICKEIVEGHKGKIWVENNKGEGSTFFFTLPFSSEKSGEI